jgi:hypothetical protein
MNPAYLGDSYDIVKRFFCDVSRSLGYTVYVDPMYTGSWTRSGSSAFLRFIGARELATPMAGPAVLLIDPDKGIRDRPGPLHTTFAAIAGRCEQFALCLVFDMSFSRGALVRDGLVRKLRLLQDLGVRGVYFDSHARFLICGRTPAPVMRFHKALVETGLPRDRFVGISPLGAGRTQF